MPVTGFNLGKDIAIDIVHPTAGIIAFGLLTNFNSKPLRTRLESKPITNGGKSVYRQTWHGWEGTFELDRADGTLDALAQLLEDSFYAGLPETYCTITETIRNPDGSTDSYRFVNVIIEPEEMGVYRGEEKVTQRFGFVATRKIRG